MLGESWRILYNERSIIPIMTPRTGETMTKKHIPTIVTLLIIGAFILTSHLDAQEMKNVAKQQPKRSYPDWMCLTERHFHEEIYHDEDDWHFHYNMDWENFLIYGMILHNKDYKIEDDTPGWFSDYVENYKVVPFDYGDKDITLVFYKKGWIRNRLTFRLEDRVSETGMVYNVSAKIEPDPEFLAGKPAPGRAAVPREIWMNYVSRHMDRLKDQSDWNPTKKPREKQLTKRQKEIETIIQKYFDGSYELDKQKARDAFHPAAHLYLVDESGAMNALTVDDFVKIFDTLPSPQSVGQKREDKIISIDFTGENTAVARVQLRIAQTRFTDILGFVYTDGGWCIVSKIASGVNQ